MGNAEREMHINCTRGVRVQDDVGERCPLVLVLKVLYTTVIVFVRIIKIGAHVGFKVKIQKNKK